jgi:amino acid transporter
MANTEALSDDERKLAELGYKQELHRNWSGFSNFAISFSIISILAGCFTTFGQAWNNGGPIAISWGWPIISSFILLIGFTMSELVSAYPTSGGIYWWASKLGGPKAGFFTGWLNLIGLLAVTASVAYGCATFIDLTISTFSESYAASYSLSRVFWIFVVVLIIASVLNIFSGHLMAIMNNVSVWWHVAGAAESVLRVHRAHQQLGVLRVRLLVPGATAGLPAHAVHDHRVRRVSAPVGGDPDRLRGRR